MRVKLYSFVFALLLSGCASMPEGRQTLTSPEGQSVLFQYMPKAKDLTVIVDWPSDWAEKNEHNPAVAHLGAQLMVLSGTDSQSAAEVAEGYSQLDAEGYLLPKLQLVRGVLHVQEKNLRPAAQLTNEVLSQPLFDTRWITRVAADRRARMQESYETSATQAWQSLAYLTITDDQAREYSLMDDLALFSKVSQADMQRWHRETFGSKGLVVAVAGKVKAKAALSAVDQLLTDLPKSSAEKSSVLQTDFSPRLVLLHKPEVEKSTLLLVGGLPDQQLTGASDMLAAAILGQGAESRLNQSIRDTLRASYGFSAAVSAYSPEARFLYLSGEVDSKKIAQVQIAATEAYQKFVEEGPSEAEFRAAKINILNQLEKRNESSTSAAAVEMIEYAEKGWQIDGEDRALVEIEQLTVESLRVHVQRTWPSVDALITVAVSADAAALENACVIERATQAGDCR